MTSTSSALARPVPADHHQQLATADDRWVQRRIGIIWGLLFFNVMPFLGGSVLPIPRPVAQLLTMGALGIALLLALSLNRALVVRPNLLLGLASILAVTSLTTAARGTAGIGAVVRSGRLGIFLIVLWLLTPWWGRRDFLLLRCHLRVLLLVCVSVLLGVLIAPGFAFSGGGGGRLVGIIWPIPAPQVAEYAALATGIAFVLWLAGAMPRAPAFLLVGVGSLMMILSHTRTAVLGLVAGVACAALSLFLSRRRVRKLASAAILLAPVAFAVVGPAAMSWFTRDQDAEMIGTLTGRKKVWEPLLAAPRPEFNQWFGFGLSDKSFNGLPIDSTWLAAYHEQGLVAVAVLASILLFLVIICALRPPGPSRAVAMFIVVYCAVASYTEVTLGDASPYLLSIVVAASLVIPAHRRGAPKSPW